MNHFKEVMLEQLMEMYRFQDSLVHMWTKTLLLINAGASVAIWYLYKDLFEVGSVIYISVFHLLTTFVVSIVAMIGTYVAADALISDLKSQGRIINDIQELDDLNIFYSEFDIKIGGLGMQARLFGKVKYILIIIWSTVLILASTRIETQSLLPLISVILSLFFIFSLVIEFQYESFLNELKKVIFNKDDEDSDKDNKDNKDDEIAEKSYYDKNEATLKCYKVKDGVSEFFDIEGNLEKKVIYRKGKPHKGFIYTPNSEGNPEVKVMTRAQILKHHREYDDFTTAIIFFNKKNEILLFKRDDKKSIPYQNCWDLIGGYREKGESPKQCVNREVMEELEIVPIELEFIKMIQIDGIDTHIYSSPLNKQIKDINLNEGQYIKWFSNSDIERLLDNEVAFGFKKTIIKLFFEKLIINN